MAERRSSIDIKAQEALAAFVALAVLVGIYDCWSRNKQAAPPPKIAASSPPAPAAPVASTSPSGPQQIAEFCDLKHGAEAELSPTSVSPKPETRTNPLTRQPVTLRPRMLTPSERDSARKVIERFPRVKIRQDCDLLDLGDGSRFVIVGLDDSCERGCRFHARQLVPRSAKFVMDLATAASMTIDVDDHVFIPSGVKSAHAGESYATTVSTPEELAKVVTSRFVGGPTQYRGPIQSDGGVDY